MQKIFTKLQALLDGHELGASGLVVEGKPETCPTGTRFVLNGEGELVEGNLGTLNPELLLTVQEDIQECLQNKKPKLITLPLTSSASPASAASPASTKSAASPIQAEGLQTALSPSSLTLFLDPIFPQTQLLILGGGHIALPLVKMGYPLGFQMTVVDDRPSFANTARFPEAEQVICGDFTKVLHELPMDASTFVVIVTRGHRHDELCLAEVLNHPIKPAYVGMIGSRRKVAAIMNNLKADGLSEELLDTVHSPIGLDIGAQTPEEIALSILAEMVRIKHYGERSEKVASMKEIRGQRSDG